MGAETAKGTNIYVSDMKTNPKFWRIAKVIDLTKDVPGPTKIDTTTLDSEGLEHIKGLKDYGSLTFNIFLDDTNYAQTLLETYSNLSTKANYEVRYGNVLRKKISFKATVGSSPTSGSTNDALKGSITLDISGKITKGFWT